MIPYSEYSKTAIKTDTYNTPLSVLLAYEIDTGVYLPSKGECLQRPLVWSQEQQQELIVSVFAGRWIPPIAINQTNGGGEKDYLEVIDGKQRLSSLIRFKLNDLAVTLAGETVHWADLPRDWRGKFDSRSLTVTKAFDLTDDEKIRWFDFLNFQSVPQDPDHIAKIKSWL